MGKKKTSPGLDLFAWANRNKIDFSGTWVRRVPCRCGALWREYCIPHQGIILPDLHSEIRAVDPVAAERDWSHLEGRAKH